MVSIRLFKAGGQTGNLANQQETGANSTRQERSLDESAPTSRMGHCSLMYN